MRPAPFVRAVVAAARALPGALAMRLALVAACTAVLAACFAPDQPSCTFRCDPAIGNSRRCPESYTCGTDNYCHLNGSTDKCPYAEIDLSVVDSAVPDLASPAPDLTSPVDAATGN